MLGQEDALAVRVEEVEDDNTAPETVAEGV